MGRPTILEQREAAAVTSPDLLRRLDRLESGESEPRWVLRDRAAVCRAVLKELVVVYARRVKEHGRPR